MGHWHWRMTHVTHPKCWPTDPFPSLILVIMCTDIITPLLQEIYNIAVTDSVIGGMLNARIMKTTWIACITYARINANDVVTMLWASTLMWCWKGFEFESWINVKIQTLNRRSVFQRWFNFQNRKLFYVISTRWINAVSTYVCPLGYPPVASRPPDSGEADRGRGPGGGVQTLDPAAQWGPCKA